MSRSRVCRRAWGALPLSLAAVLGIPGCQDGYPIAPTPCDHYCELGLGPTCREFVPTSCVAYCEASTFSLACPTEFEAWVACLKSRKHRLECDYAVVGRTDGCETEQGALSACVLDHGLRAPSGAE